MTARTDVSGRVVPGQEERASAAVYTEGLLAGVAGAATVAAWFLLLDSIAGRPFFTPSLLGTALVHGGAEIAAPETLPVNMEMVVNFTWMHVLAFMVIGLAASKLLEQAERDPNLGFGILLLFVVFEFGFIAVFSNVASEVLEAISWPSILVGNLLAAAAMGLVFWRRHPRLVIRP
jgi:hypothetical protein